MSPFASSPFPTQHSDLMNRKMLEQQAAESKNSLLSYFFEKDEVFTPPAIPTRLYMTNNSPQDRMGMHETNQ